MKYFKNIRYNISFRNIVLEQRMKYQFGQCDACRGACLSGLAVSASEDLKP